MDAKPPRPSLKRSIYAGSMIPSKIRYTTPSQQSSRTTDSSQSRAVLTPMQTPRSAKVPSSGSSDAGEKKPTSAQKFKPYDLVSLRNENVFLEAEHLKLQNELSREKLAKDEVRIELNKLKSELALAEEKYNKDVSAKRSEIESLNRRLEICREEAVANECIINRLRSDLNFEVAAEKDKAQSAEFELSEAQERIRQLENDLQSEKLAKKHELSLIRSHLKHKEGQLEHFKSCSMDQQSFMMENQSKIDRVDQLEEENRQLRSKLASWESSGVVNSTHKQVIDELRRVKSELTDMTHTAKVYEEMAGNTDLLQEQNNDLTKQVCSLESRLQTLAPIEEELQYTKERLAAWEALKEYDPSLSSKSAVISKIHQLKISANLSRLNQSLNASDAHASEADTETLADLRGELLEARQKISELTEQNRLLNTKLTLTQKHKSSCDSFLSTFSFGGGGGESGNGYSTMQDDVQRLQKVIELKQSEIDSYKGMVEDYDATVKDLRAQKQELEKQLESCTPQVSFLMCDTPEKKMSPVALKAQERAITLAEGDLAMQMKQDFYREMGDLRAENEELRRKILRLNEEKQRLARQEGGVAISSVGDTTMSHCITGSEEYKHLMKENTKLKVLNDGLLNRFKQIRHVARHILGFNIYVMGDNRSMITPIFPSPLGIKLDFIVQELSDSDSQPFVLEETEAVDHYRHFIDVYSHKAASFASLILDLYEKQAELPDELSVLN